MTVKIRRKKISKGRHSLFLDIHGQGRHREYLKLFVYDRPKDQLEKLHNEETLRQADKLKTNRQLELQAQSHGIAYAPRTSQTFEEHFQQVIDDYPYKDVRKLTGALRHFRLFHGSKPFFLSQPLLDKFKRYFRESELEGETPFMYLGRFKAVCISAFKAGVLKTDPAAFDWSYKFDRHALRKEVLDADELRRLAATPCGNDEVRKLFLFCCNTGLRFGDAKNLTWGKVKGMKLKIEQGKTGRYLPSPLNSNARKLIGKPGPDDQHVFDLKGIDGINKVIENWYKRAKIDKHITTHCARHTFCTMLMQNKVDPKTIISLMGWSEENGMKQLMRYSHLVDESVRAAVDSLPSLD